MKNIAKWGVAAMCMAAPLTILAAPIREVEVNLGQMHTLPPYMSKRITAGIQTAGEKVLIGRDTEDVRQRQDAYRALLTDIVGRILYGYNVEDLQIELGATSRVSLNLTPYGEVIQDCTVQIHYGNLDARVKPLLDRDLQGIAAQVPRLLVGLPLDSLEWSKGAAIGVLRDRLETVLPEFASQVEISGEKQLQVDVYLIPKGHTIRHSVTEIESPSLPAMVFVSTKRHFDTYLERFEGIPSDFVLRHEVDIVEEIQDELEQSVATRRFNIHFTPRLEADRQLTLILQVEPTPYVIQSEARLDMGRKEDSLGFVLHTGVRQGRQEWYWETAFYPENYSWKFYPSYAYRVMPDTTVGYQYDLREEDHRIYMAQDLGERWHLRLQRDLRAKHNEFGLRYDVHNYLSLEYIFDNKDNWLRLIGHI